MGFARPGCKIIKGEIFFDGIDLIQASEKEKRNLRGSRISYVAQSAAASFNPAHRLIEQTIESSIHHKLKNITDDNYWKEKIDILSKTFHMYIGYNFSQMFSYLKILDICEKNITITFYGKNSDFFEFLPIASFLIRDVMDHIISR